MQGDNLMRDLQKPAGPAVYPTNGINSAVPAITYCCIGNWNKRTENDNSLVFIQCQYQKVVENS